MDIRRDAFVGVVGGTLAVATSFAVAGKTPGFVGVSRVEVSTDENGTVQPEEFRSAYPNGPTGWVSRTIET
ncbi:hypothetical protein BG842_07165 [Haladaptatus sp. W1]|uniref:hypothetical protein n=1 Tax=Haladaptatus sp. W1 TaxID=1897478 RepID=UPI000849C9BD|nr:hypothetical protein [Haladaptatus sp. W1]ODR79804.1 hypothetical protein BG842_07165 [Haladaptatus sp. W1]